MLLRLTERSNIVKVVIHKQEQLYPCVIMSTDPEDLQVWPDRTYEVPDNLYEAYTETGKILRHLEYRILAAAFPAPEEDVLKEQ